MTLQAQEDSKVLSEQLLLQCRSMIGASKCWERVTLTASTQNRMRGCRTYPKACIIATFFTFFIFFEASQAYQGAGKNKSQSTCLACHHAQSRFEPLVALQALNTAYGPGKEAPGRLHHLCSVCLLHA